MDEQLQKYLQEKYAEQLGGLNTAQAFANLGDVIGGQKVGTTSPFFTEQRKLAEEQTLGEINKQRDLEMKKAQLAETLQTKLMQLQQQKDQAQSANEIRKLQLEQSQQIAESNQELRRMAIENQKAMATERAAERAAKKEELSGTQAKQLGLAQAGQTAASQYEAAIKKGAKETCWQSYDPTSYGDWLQSQSWTPSFLKSASDKEAQAAKSAWVETYLRDASGAAIAPSERLAYAKDYFEEPGDSPQVVANKAVLREQKEKTALLGAGPGAKRFEKVETPQVPSLRKAEKSVSKKMYSPSRNETKLIYSDGTEEVLSGKQ
jgi:hypothetical protein